MLIYIIKNNFNNKVYIGQTKLGLENRIYWYKKDIEKGNRDTKIILAMKEHGFENFSFEILEDGIESQELLDERERYWIRKYNSTNPENGYNSDTGGIKGCYKSNETKLKISESSQNNWENKDTASKMLEGLKKGTETVKERAKNNFVEVICLNCRNPFKLKPYEAKTRKFCSHKCKGEYETKSGSASTRGFKAGISIHQSNVAKKEEIKQTIIDWVNQNKSIVQNCPKNKITTNLKPLFDLIYNIYNIKDIRSIFLCFDVNNRKDLLNALQQL